MQNSSYYEPCPSIFQVIEYPMRYLHDYQIRTRPSILGLPNLMLTVVLCPITICAAPLTMLGDIIIGIAEIAFAYYKGCNIANLKSIAHKKLIASPIQHMVFIAVNASGCVAVAFYLSVDLKCSFISCLPFSGVLMVLTYAGSQRTLGSLPNWFQPDGFNIFIDGGASNLDGEKYTKYFDESYQKFKKNWQANINSWDDKCTKLVNDLKLKEVKTECNILISYDQFKNGIIKKLKPKQLLGLNENFTKKELKTTYRQFSFFLHPDRNHNRITESTALMQFFFSVYNDLEKSSGFSSL